MRERVEGAAANGKQAHNRLADVGKGDIPICCGTAVRGRTHHHHHNTDLFGNFLGGHNRKRMYYHVASMKLQPTDSNASKIRQSSVQMWALTSPCNDAAQTITVLSLGGVARIRKLCNSPFAAARERTYRFKHTNPC